MLNGHGDDLHLVKGQIKYNFSSNVYYKGCPTAILKALAKQVEGIQNYPSPAAEELSECASIRYQQPAENFLFTNGAIEAFYLIAQLFRGKRSTIVGPTFSEYEDACKMHNISYTVVEKEKLDSFNTDLVFICNPNNPTGSVFSFAELEYFITENPTSTFVIDEAYIEFTKATKSVLPLVEKHKNLIVVRSLTKTFTIPGLRLGYIISDASMVEKLKAIRIPWSVNGLAIQTGKYLFENYDQLIFDIESLLKERIFFQDQLRVIDHIEVQETNTSYFLVKLLKGKASELKNVLISKGILIRDATNFTSLEGEFIRLSVQSPTANKQIIKALTSWI
ncbi:pyridoxal phosphate-dependent aminotransferase [Flammeovirga agarivorans]|uniref:Pyridoxal phosphate-dependent class II aminotransferase n=1 Tax=Flammeovirga agarivorans TaxID=2726742 RepID=A0A7X8SMN6_9BACT|nr:aminotransferase class I/II-fold pyridoxal phosphate-dependent enzyme [Flammeovirga agarivorans]NLR92981.1 pyridoxal phosphate-dependent class II aminotransferase [Flammeovirga agarivorans]